MQNLADKIALITGGSSGIGRATALAFANAGAKVVIAARGVERGEDAVREIQESGGEATFIQADMALSSDIEMLVERAVEVYGRLDCAFNNAASTGGAFSPTADFSEEEFDRTIAVNLKGVWLCMKHEIQQMLRQDPPGGVIVNTSSGGDPEARKAVEERYTQFVPLGRIGHPEEAAEVVVWLCSDAASYVTGHSMIVDGGLTAFVR